MRCLRLDNRTKQSKQQHIHGFGIPKENLIEKRC